MSHFIFNNKEVNISPDLRPIIIFLQTIEEDIEENNSLFEKKKKTKENMLKLLNLCKSMTQRMKDENINFEFKDQDYILKLTDELDLIQYSLRFQFLGLFAYIETLMTFHIAYTHKIDSEAEIIKFSNEKTFKQFWNRYFFTKNNEYYKSRKKIFSKTNADTVRKLRNGLFHFLSPGQGIGMIHHEFSQKARKIEKKIFKKGAGTIFISDKDLYSLTTDAFKLIMKDWSDDYLNNPELFQESIKNVSSIVVRNGGHKIQDKHINI